MAEGDGTVYNVFKFQLLNGFVNLANGQDVIKVGLLTGYTPDIDTHDEWADVSGDEESGAGYTAGGEILANQVTTNESATDNGKLDGDDVTWTGLDVGTPSDAVMYDDTTVTPTDMLMAFWEILTASNGGNYTLQWNALGIITLS
jgi:hypothetical protein